MGVKGVYRYNVDLIVSLCDGTRTSHEIAKTVGCSAKYVQDWMIKRDLPRLPQGPRRGANNPAWIGGRVIDRDGYVLTPAPVDHPYRRLSGAILEHRLVLEQKIGRYLKPTEVVDHIDGLHLHNHPNNLRLFATNGQHLSETLTGQIPKWSQAGLKVLGAPHHLRSEMKQVDTYNQRKKRGEIRLQQILLAWLQLDKDSPYLLCTHRLLEKAGIDCSSRSNLQQALDNLYLQWQQDH